MATSIDGASRKRARPLSRAGVAEQDRYLLRRYRDFRRAADAVAAAWRARPEVAAVNLIGSVAKAPWKEVPRFQPYRRARIDLWHECKDLDLALVVTDLQRLDRLRRAKDRALRILHERGGPGVASHQVDVFLLEPGTGRYLGRLCDFNACPKGKPACLVTGCGAVPFLRQHEDFTWQAETLAADRSVCLFDRATSTIHRAIDLPLPTDETDDPAQAP